ncbi:hypothetical protein LCGC14_1616640 [marine sediment metagenome]|uniref:Uncharacterized protein n=1 Tax=marine sediment metagenome TaxID=412755 RepID=A0A0F9I6Z8_9ZZZZ
MPEKTRVLLRYEVIVYEIKEVFDESPTEGGEEWLEVNTNILCEEDFATVHLVEGTPTTLNLVDKVLNLAKACARGYLKGVECPKWEVPK